VKQLIDYKLAVLTYKARQSGRLSYLTSLISDCVPSRSLRSSDKLLLSRPYTSLVMSDKAFSVNAPKIWNDLSFNCRAATCVNSFKRNLKREHFYTAYADHSHAVTVASRASDSVFLLELIGALAIGFVLHYCKFLIVIRVHLLAKVGSYRLVIIMYP